MGGLGEAICIKLAALGYTVVTTHSPGNTKADEWLDVDEATQGYAFHAYPCDVADFDSAAGVRRRRSRGEVGPVDVLVNNAGITRDMTFKKMDKAELGCGHQDQPRLVLQHDASRCATAWSSAAGAASSTSRR